MKTESSINRSAARAKRIEPVSSVHEISSVRESSEALSVTEEKRQIDELNEKIWKGTWKGDWSRACIEAEEVLSRAERIGYKKGIASAKLNLGQFYRLTSSAEKGEATLIEARELFREIGDDTGLGSVWHQLGLINLYASRYARSIEAYLEAREIWLRHDDRERLATSELAIGSLYAALEEYDRADEQYQLAITFYKECGNAVGYARVLSNYARVKQAQKNEQHALELQLEAIAILEANNLKGNVAATLLNLGSTYCKLKEYCKSIEVLTKGLEFADENAYRRAQFIGRLNLAQTYLESKDIQNARRLFKEAQSFAEGDVQDTLPMQQGLEASICAAEGDHKRAYEIQCEAQAHRTELLSAQIQQAVATRMAHYNFHQALKARAEREQSDRELEAMRRHQLEQQLTSTAMSLAAQTDLLATFREDLTEIIRSIAEPSTALRHVRDKLKALPCEQLDWMQFEVQFTEVHPEFRAKLVEKYPMLTKQEIKMCQLARLGLKTTEMARLLCLSERSIESHRYSLRKKLGLSSEQNLTEFLQSTT